MVVVISGQCSVWFDLIALGTLFYVEPLPKNFQPLPKKPHWNFSTSRKFLNPPPPPPKISQSPESFSTPGPRKFLNSHPKISEPPPKISHPPPLKISNSTRKNLNPKKCINNYHSPILFFFFLLPLFLHFSKKKSKFFWGRGDLNPLNPHPLNTPLKTTTLWQFSTRISEKH